MLALQQSHLPESAEILDLLNKIEFEGLFYSHDKLASLQGGLPWKKCLAEMWSKAGIVTGYPNYLHFIQLILPFEISCNK